MAWRTGHIRPFVALPARSGTAGGRQLRAFALVVRRAWRCGRDSGFALKLHPIDVFRAHSDRVAELDVLLGSIAPRGPRNGLGRGITGPRERDQTIRHLVGKLPVVRRPIARGPEQIQRIQYLEPIGDIGSDRRRWFADGRTASGPQRRDERAKTCTCRTAPSQSRAPRAPTSGSPSRPTLRAPRRSAW